MKDFMSKPQNKLLRLRSVTRVMTAAFQAPIYTIGQPPFGKRWLSDPELRRQNRRDDLCQ
jgi:hypothetical protein